MMAQPALSAIRFLATVMTICTFIGSGVHGRTIRLNWTAEGVREFTSTPLGVELGDMLELVCDDNISNLFIQADQSQYDSCNASAGSGEFDYNGLCFPGNPAMLTLTENSKSLDNTVNFVNNQAYFLTSYSDGEFRANDATFTSGGQCEDGLRIIIIIGDIEVPTSGNNGGGGNQQGPGPPISEGLNTGTNRSSSSTTDLPIIIGAVAGGVVVLCITVIIIIIIVCVKKGRCSKEGKTTSHGNNLYSFTNNNNKGTDSQSCTLTRAAEIDYNLNSRPVIEIDIHETVPQANDEVNKPITFYGNKRLGSADFLNEKSHYKSAEKSFDDATGQISTPLYGNTTPEHLLKAKSTSELTSLPGTLPTRKPKPIPPKKPRQQDMYKSSSADNLISR